MQRAVTEDRDNANAVFQTARSLTKLNTLLLALKITAKFIFLSNVFHAEKQIEREEKCSFSSYSYKSPYKCTMKQDFYVLALLWSRLASNS